jgi:hypothetical protein
MPDPSDPSAGFARNPTRGSRPAHARRHWRLPADRSLLPDRRRDERESHAPDGQLQPPRVHPRAHPARNCGRVKPSRIIPTTRRSRRLSMPIARSTSASPVESRSSWRRSHVVSVSHSATRRACLPRRSIRSEGSARQGDPTVAPPDPYHPAKPHYVWFYIRI